jgi:DNA replication and repair protein RecF
MFDFPPGLTVISGGNGEGKTTVLEAISYLASLGSFRAVSNDTLVKVGTPHAVIRAELDIDGREQLVEAQIVPGSKNRIQVNRQPLRRARDLLGTVRVVVFAPDDLHVVKGSPGERRRFLDDALSSLSLKFHTLRGDLDKVIRQRNTVLKQAGGRETLEVAATLDVWDLKLAEFGEQVASQRRDLCQRLEPFVTGLYHRLAGSEVSVSLSYRSEWSDVGLMGALNAARSDELRRKVTLVGPHRDDLEIVLDHLPAKTHASQGEQRTLALAMRLATQRVIAAETGREPIVLLDDVFSELDETRAAALMSELPASQTILTTATGTVPTGEVPAASYVVDAGAIVGSTRPPGREHDEL